MNQTATIADIRGSRDAALKALNDVMLETRAEIRKTTKDGMSKQLLRRYDDLRDEYFNIVDLADEAVLAHPDVISAVTTLKALSAEMKKTAEEEPDATKLLDKGTKVVSLGQRFSNVLANA